MSIRKKSLMAAAGLTAGAALALGVPAPAQASPQLVHHAITVCQTTTFYYGWNPGINGTAGDANYTLLYGNKVGWQDAAPIYNGWVNVIDYGGAQTWGWIRQECLGGIDSW